MRTTLLAMLLLCSAGSATAGAAPATTNNDDSCDIGLAPAATLLLPYFDVETANHDLDTLFTVTNVTPLPQIAKVTLWTDWAFPVVSFSIFLTGYDVQSISLYDVIAKGAIAQTGSETIPGRASGRTATIRTSSQERARRCRARSSRPSRMPFARR